MRITRLIPGTIALIGFAWLAPGIALADAAMAKATAAQHAGLAAGSDAIGMVHRHLHHALNCLVGPEGEGFDEAAGNPCREQGSVIPETADAEMKESLEAVAKQVREAIANNDMTAVKEVAMSVQEALGET